MPAPANINSIQNANKPTVYSQSKKKTKSYAPDKGNPFLNKIDKKNPDLFFNREISWLHFNQRVLREATRKEKPLLEKLRFLGIFETNLLEFFMIRVAGLKQMKASSYSELQLDGRTSLETLQEISRMVHSQLEEMGKHIITLYDELQNVGVHILKNYHDLNTREKKFTNSYFQSDLFRILTPLAVDPGHPFPRITSGRLNLVVSLERKTEKNKVEEVYALIEVPNVLPRFVRLPSSSNPKKNTIAPVRFIALEEIIKMHSKELFLGTKIKNIDGFTIIRNSDLAIDEVASDNLLSTVEDELKNRRWGEVVCLHCRQGLPENMKKFLRDELDIENYEIYERPTILNMQHFQNLYDEIHGEYSHLCDPPFIPYNALPFLKNTKGYQNIFAAMREKDRLFHHPYDSFQSVIDLLNIAARDPKVLAIKQTLYRTGKDSPFVKALIMAAENGKQVTALVELKARFDEERNISWAKEMENHGIHVVYGLVGLKIHSKILQIVRRSNEDIQSYTHLSTGNYNPSTAKYYTDIGLLTADPEMNHDVTNLFHSLTGVAALPHFKKIATAPINMRYTILRLIQKEIANAEQGRVARIRLKMNALVDPEMIVALYRASCAGVEIRLNVRGICCLRPGITGVSDNIHVVSIVGQFLEHSRIFCFENGGKPQVFLCSADWMPRNLNRRVEILFPIKNPEHIEYLIFILETAFRDTYCVSKLKSDGTYRPLRPKGQEAPFSSQLYFREKATKAVEKKDKDKSGKRKTLFQPLSNPAKEDIINKENRL